MKVLIVIICVYFFCELIILYFIKKSKDIKWIITKKNLSELFNEKKFLRFKRKNFNYKLGWNKKSEIKNFDYLNNKKIFYSINKKGYRNSKFYKKKTRLYLLVTLILFVDKLTIMKHGKNSYQKKKIFSYQISVLEIMDWIKHI